MDHHDDPHLLTRWDGWISLALFVGVLVLLMVTADGIGVTRDESFYFHAAKDYIGWFRGLWVNVEAGQVMQSFTQAEVDRYWSYNPEHPVLMKTLFALSYELFHVKLEWLSFTTSMRLPTMVLSAALISMVYAFGKQLFGRGAGLLGALFLLLQPRFFFHAHMACFDVPIVAVWFATVWAYWKSLTSKRWAVVTGIFWGIALAAKLNAFFIPVMLVIHWVLTQGPGVRVRRREGQVGVTLPRVPWAFVAMALIGPLIFYLHWPRIWFDTFARVKWYMVFHLKHVHYFVYYLGQNLYQPPFPRAFPWVMTWVTVPATCLVAGVVGALAWAGQWRARGAAWWRAMRQKQWPPMEGVDPRGTGVLIGINFAFALFLIGQPETPVFGGTKHWMTSMPYLSMVAGFGVIWAIERLREATIPTKVKHAVAVCLVALTVGSLVQQTVHNYPHGTSYYNEFIGSHRGAADAKMMRQFWGHGARYGVDWMHQNWGDQERVWTHNSTHWAWEAYQRDGTVKKGWRPAGMGGDWGLFVHQKAFVPERMELHRRYGVKVPVHVENIDGVPILSIYERPEHRARRLSKTQTTTP